LRQSRKPQAERGEAEIVRYLQRRACASETFTTKKKGKLVNQRRKKGGSKSVGGILVTGIAEQVV